MSIPWREPEIEAWLLAALHEDIGAGDITTAATVEAETTAMMEWVAKSELMVAGLPLAERAFRLLDPELSLLFREEEGRLVSPGAVILSLRGKARALLSAERVALNVVQRLCGIATLTHKFVAAVAGTQARIAATRKTTPLLRKLEKYAVSVGGGIPHRFGLDDGVLIKDNHIVAAGGITAAVRRAKAKAHHLLRVEVEVRSLAEAEEALDAGAEVLLLDNMSVSEMAAVVAKLKGRVVLEASGNITLENVAQVARTGVDIISVGALTHSAPAADISARLFFTP